jgi:hypothetical protein
LLNSKVNEIITNGFDYLLTVVDNTYNLISNDVHQDKFKGYSNQQFDDERNRLKYFLAQRKNFLMGKVLFNRIRVDEFNIKNPFPQSNKMSIVEVKLNQEAEVFFEYVPKYDVKNGSPNFNVRSIQLYDDGSMSDKVAGDLIYSNAFFLQDYEEGIIPFSIRIGDNYYPANGFSYFGYGPTVTFALSSINSDIDLENSLSITSVNEYYNDQIIIVKNIGIQEIDLTYFKMKGNNSYDSFVFPPGIKLSAGNDIAITTNKELAEFLYPSSLSLEYLSFHSEVNDTLKIYSPANTLIIKKNIDAITEPEITVDNIVINEINYHSSDSFDTGDWVEFYNPNDHTIFLNGFKFKDERDDHIYTFPASAIINAKGYFVLCQDVELFKSIHTDVQAMGNFVFGLSNAGEKIRLFDNNDVLINQVNYSDDDPWSPQADGEGYTLELINHENENDNYENWKASTILGGTPGQANSVSITSIKNDEDKIPKQYELYQNYPNPFNPTTIIKYSIPIGNNNTQNVQIVIYDVLGRELKILVNRKQSPGNYSITFEADNLSSGVYYYSLKVGNYIETKKMVLIR